MKKILWLLALLMVQSSWATDLDIMATHNGFIIKSEVADISTMSSVIVCVPPFREKYFYNIESPIELVNSPNRGEIVQKGDKSKVDIQDYSITREGDSIILNLEANLTHSDATDIEHTLFVAPEYLLADSTYVGETMSGEKLSGHITPNFEGELQVQHVVEEVKKIEFSNSYGTLTLEVLSGEPFLVGDRRGIVFEERRCFWLGHQVPMIEGEKYHCKVKITYQVNQNLKIVSPFATSNEQAITTIDSQAVGNFDFTPPLIPVPKAIEYFKTKGFKPPKDMNVEFFTDKSRANELLKNSKSFNISADSNRLLKAAQKLTARFSGESEIGSFSIVISPNGTRKLIPPKNPEGYVLQVLDDGITLVSRSEKGAFYGLQTLRSLIGEDGVIPAVLIRDEPDMSMRAVHFLMPDSSGYEFLSRIITEVMVPMKMNMFILECEYVNWESIPELQVAWGMSKEDCQKLIALCEENFIEPIPLLQTLSHAPWLFANGQNLDMCEDPEFAYAYFTSHPDIYPLMEKILDEVMDTFNQPRYIHIGHDELYTWGKYPNRPESIAIGTKKLVYDDVMWYYNYAKNRQSQIMMWHDIFVTKEESPENGHGGGNPDWVDEIRPDLPRDIIFCVWRYAGKNNEFIDLEHLAAESFEVVGSSWFEINNVENLTKATRRVGGTGMISTTWIYPDVDGVNKEIIVNGCHNALDNWFFQVAPYTRSGAWSWNCDDSVNQFNGKELFVSLLENSRNEGVKSGKMIDLNSVANIELSKIGNPFLTGDDMGFEDIESGIQRVGRVNFNIPKSNNHAAAIALKSRLTSQFPEQVIVNIEPQKSSKLYILHTAIGIQPNPKEVVVNYTINYADGSSATLPARYQIEIAPPEEDVNYRLATGNMLRFMNKSQPMSIWYATFDNPNPELAINSITISGTESEFPVYVLGVTLQD